MLKLRAHVENGRVIVDDTVDFPDGTELSLVTDESFDDVDDLAGLHKALDESEAQLARGEGMPIDNVLAHLGMKR